MKAFIVNRDVTRKECPWLERTIKTGETVYEYTVCTYGCIGAGRAVSFQPNGTPFFELPRDALTE